MDPREKGREHREEWRINISYMSKIAENIATQSSLGSHDIKIAREVKFACIYFTSIFHKIFIL